MSSGMSSGDLYQCRFFGLRSMTLDFLLNHKCFGASSESEKPHSDPINPDVCALAFQQAEAGCSSGGSRPVTPPLERWDDRDVRLLIACYSKFKHLLGKGKTTKKDVFAKIAEDFNATSNKIVTADQCLRKWSKLEEKQKEVEDHNKLTGRERKTWKFHDDMSDCIGTSPNINPLFTFDTSSGSPGGSKSQCGSNVSDMSDVDEDGEAEEPGPKTKAKMPKRKRKSNFSAVEMLQLLHSYNEKREKVEAEKLEVMKSMKEEKKINFIHHSLICLKRSKATYN